MYMYYVGRTLMLRLSLFESWLLKLAQVMLLHAIIGPWVVQVQWISAKL